MTNISGPSEAAGAHCSARAHGALLRRRPAAGSAATPADGDFLVARPAPGLAAGAVAPTKPTPLVASDLMWARLPGPAPLPTGVLSFPQRVPYADAVVFARKLFAVPAFARRFTTGARGAIAWETVSNFDVARHLKHRAIDARSDSAAFSVAFAQWCQAPMHEGLPPWDMTLVDCTDRSLIFVRTHHAITDGPGMMQALLSCHDDPEAWPRAERHVQTLMARRAPRRALRNPCAGMLEWSWRMAATWAATAVRGSAVAMECARSALAIAVRSADRQTVIKPLQPVEHLRYARVPQSWPIETLKRIAHAQGPDLTVNDVVVTVLTGALRDVLAAAGEPVDQITLRAMQTVNMPRKADGTNAGSNNVGLAMSNLPIHVGDVKRRMASVHAIMRRFKNTAEPWVAAKAMALVARLPQAVIDFMHRRTTSQCSVLISNVMGPIEPFVLNGQAAEGMFWAAPRFGDVGVVVPVMSYAGTMQAAVQVGSKLKVDPTVLAERVQAHYEELRRALGVA